MYKAIDWSVSKIFIVGERQEKIFGDSLWQLSKMLIARVDDDDLQVVSSPGLTIKVLLLRTKPAP